MAETLPDIDFPTFPDPLDKDGVPVIELQNGEVTMPFYYWQKIATFAIESESVKKQYNVIQQMYSK